jgi:hypothetical protein
LKPKGRGLPHRSRTEDEQWLLAALSAEREMALAVHAQTLDRQLDTLAARQLSVALPLVCSKRQFYQPISDCECSSGSPS